MSPLVSRISCITIGAALLSFSNEASACSYYGVPATDEQLEAYHRQILPRLTELFEAEILKVDGDNSEMKVLRVHRGTLKPGMILRGAPALTSCDTRMVRAGEKGVVWVSFGPAGPSFVARFITERTAQSLKRIGALPKD